MSAIGVLAGAIVASGLSALDAWANLLLGVVAGFAFAGAGNALNDFVDVDLDRVAHPNRPLPRGAIQPRAALVVTIALFVVSVGCAGAIAWTTQRVDALLLVLSALVLMVAYEARLKFFGFSGNVAIALLTGAPFVMGGIAVGRLEPALAVFSGLAVLANLGREIVKDVEDVAADTGVRRTLPMRIGIRSAARVAQASLVCGV
ncbi:MAG TPA: geranylgeranylglycerol-phosphate geranylgeranyltransferase, partial [Burkholderiales bacterium]|nr:geranylgeranylglycerol-phosphate geranylgeranyltransferase [Burkholderiales bacterium]